MQKYAFSVDDGAHTDQQKVFTSLEEATKYFQDQVKEAEKDPEKYFGQSKSDWNDDCFPHIEITKVDDDNIFQDEVDEWVPDY